MEKETFVDLEGWLVPESVLRGLGFERVDKHGRIDDQSALQALESFVSEVD